MMEVSIVACVLAGFSMAVAAVWKLARAVCGLRLQRRLKHLPESMREGSSLVTVALSNFPFVVGIFVVKKKGSAKKEFRGSGTILEGHIITANHVLTEVKPAITGDDPAYDVYARTHDGVYHKLDEWVQLCTDAVAFKAPMGYKSARVEPMHKNHHAQAVAARESANSSMGVVRSAPEIAYGFVEYDGSTIAGFSGSPYTNGQKVFGMHLQGGQGNFGYSGSYLVSLLKKIKKLESSEWAAFEHALQQTHQKNIEWDRGLDETQVRVGGRYFMFENEEFDAYIEESEFMDWFYDEASEGPKSYKKFKTRSKARFEPDPDVDYEPEGGDDSFLVNTPQPDLGGGVSKKDIDSLLSSIKLMNDSLTSMKAVMDGQSKELELLREASTFTQNLEPILTERITNLHNQSMIGLSQILKEQIVCGINDLSCQVKMDSMPGSKQSSEPSTQPQPAVWEPSPVIPPSDKRWDGMESHFEMFKTWRRSCGSSSTDYPKLRAAYLASLGLTQNQSNMLIRRMQNYLRKSNHRAQERQMRQPPTA